ncbi:cupin domain-containing protein [Actinocorallia aurea]
MKIVRSSEVRRTSTPAATMTTLASPTLGQAATSVWRVDAAPGASDGPLHVIDAEQVWTFLSGTAIVEAGGRAETLAAGDTIVIPAGHPPPDPPLPHHRVRRPRHRPRRCRRGPPRRPRLPDPALDRLTAGTERTGRPGRRGSWLCRD